MANPTASTDPAFLGKDQVSIFIGQVESVDDPKRSNRVKVRCVGVHTKDKKELPTEDLPWAKVGMPATHPQQNRIGGKHGLLPGSWVLGVWLDGQEYQDPYILTTFNFTAKTSEKNLRKDMDVSEGKMDDEEEGFTTITPKMEGQEKNLSIITETEAKSGGDDKADPQHNAESLDASQDGECPMPQSEQERKTKEDRSKEGSNAEGQKYKVRIGDGKCGPVTGARDAIQDAIKEYFPPEAIRIVYNDVVFNAISGDKIQLNSIMNLLSVLIASYMKASIQTQKGFVEEITNRIKFSASLKVPDRDGIIRTALDLALSSSDDAWHAAFVPIIEMLAQQVFNSLKNVNNQGSSGKGQNYTSDTGNNPETKITDTEARCIADSIIEDANVSFDDKVEEELKKRDERVEKCKTKIYEIQEEIDQMSVEDYECEEDYTDSVNDKTKDILKAVEEITNESTGGGGGGGDGMGFLQQVLQMKAFLKPLIFNKMTLGALLEDAQEGCIGESMYDTAMGFMGSSAGVGAGGGNGGGSESGKSSKKNKDLIKHTGFAGKPGKANRDKTTDKPICDEATITQGNIIKPGGRNARVIAVSEPSSNLRSAASFVVGIPNITVVYNPGHDYWYPSKYKNRNFPSVHIQGYDGTPIPVVDRKSGEIVSILTSPESFSPNLATPTVSIHADDSSIGITSDDENYDIVLSGVYVSNTGREYTSGCFKIIDPDTGKENGTVRAVILDGRIVDIEVINSGTGFKRRAIMVPCDDTGYGAVLVPIMGLVQKNKEMAKKIPDPIHLTFCPGKNQKNAI